MKPLDGGSMREYYTHSVAICKGRTMAKAKTTIEYSRVNYFRLAQPPHHGRPRLNVVQIKTRSGYPIPSTSNQRRRPWRLNGHRGVGAKSAEIKRSILRNDPDTGQAIREWQPVGIWRGLDKRILREYNAKYTGAKLRAIRAIKGVGRPCPTPLPA